MFLILQALGRELRVAYGRLVDAEEAEDEDAEEYVDVRALPVEGRPVGFLAAVPDHMTYEDDEDEEDE